MKNATTATINPETIARNNAIAAYLKGKTLPDVLRAPIVTYTVTVDGKETQRTTRIDAMRAMTDDDAKKAVRDKCVLIAAQVESVAKELSAAHAQDTPKVHRRAMITLMSDVAGLLGLNVNIGAKDAAFIVAACTRVKYTDKSAATSDIAIASTAWRAVQRVLTNKLLAYEARILRNNTTTRKADDDKPDDKSTDKPAATTAA